MSCLTTTTTNCGSCGANCSDCPNGRIDTSCVQYTGDDLDNLGVESGDYLQDILIKLDEIVFNETPFVATSTDSITAVSGGTLGHNPLYSVKIDPDSDNVISVSSLGLMVDQNLIGDGKVKVDNADDKDYLGEQLAPGTDPDGIVTITPTVLAGKVYMVPSINIENLLTYIKENYSELLCQIAQECIPEETTTTTTTSSTTTTSTSTTTTTTTTAPPNDFDISNNSGIAVPFSIFFTDQDSLIDYVVDTTTGNGQFSHYQYNGTTNLSKITIQHSPTVSVGIQVFVDSVEVYDATDSVGSVTIEDIDARADVLVILTTPSTTTTTTTSSTTSTSTSSTTTTSTSSTTTTSTSSTTTTTTTVAQTYYLADKYLCGTCENVEDDVLISLPTSHTVQIGKFYTPVVDDGYVYTIVNTTPQSAGPHTSLTVNNYTTCAGACAS